MSWSVIIGVSFIGIFVYSLYKDSSGNREISKSLGRGGGNQSKLSKYR
jgi:hypothetical protein